MRGLVIVLAVLTTVAAADGRSEAETAPAAAHDPPVAEHACEAAQGVRVRQASAHEAGLVCEGARRAMQFLHEAGLQWPDRLIIDVMDRLPGELDGRAIGTWVDSLPDDALTPAQVDLAWQTVLTSIGRPHPLA